jgi:hypothetical protein
MGSGNAVIPVFVTAVAGEGYVIAYVTRASASAVNGSVLGQGMRRERRYPHEHVTHAPRSKLFDTSGEAPKGTAERKSGARTRCARL